MNETPVPSGHPIMRAWIAYKDSTEFSNSFEHAANPDYRVGSMWAAFANGWALATKQAAALHESINPASDQERDRGDPGAGAMGAVIEYRDKIRESSP